MKIEAMKIRQAGLKGILLVTTLMCAPQAYAQSEPASPPAQNAADTIKMEPVLVTARRRAEQAYEVPSSLDVFSGDALDNLGVTSLQALQFQTPGLNIATGGESTRVSLRGVGTNIGSGAPSVAVHIDGVYIPNTQFALTELFDLERVEVVKGPQGTLYGRNATGGVINLITQGPGETAGMDGWIGYGSFNLLTAQVGATLPLGERGGLRISGALSDDDGYTKNINPAGGEIDSRGYAGARLRGQYSLTDNLLADFTIQYSEDNGTLGYGGSNNPDSPVFASVPTEQRTAPDRINVDTAPDSHKQGLLLAGTLTWDVGDITIKSITGYGEYEFSKRSDIDGSGGFIAFATTDFETEFLSQEFQVLGETDRGLSWTAGAYYARETSNGRGIETDADFPDTTPYIYTDVTQTIEDETIAVFGEATLPLTSKLSATLGARYTSSRQDGDGIFAAPLFLPEPVLNVASTDDNGFAPKLLVEYAPYDGGRLYASATRGFKSGGVNIGFESDTFNPEKIWAYEIGAKNRLADGRVELDMAAFYYDYSDLQLRTALFTDTGIEIRISNASRASIAGLELSGLFRLTPALTADLAGTYIDSELKDFISPVTRTEITGLAMPLTPEVSYTAGMQYETQFLGQGTLTGRLEANYQSAVTFPQFTDLSRERRGAVTLINANLRYDFPDEKLYLALIGRNLGDSQDLTQRFFFQGFADTEYYSAPRTIEARLGFRF